MKQLDWVGADWLIFKEDGLGGNGVGNGALIG